MAYEIYDWLDISRRYKSSILLGNGASISLDKSFTYASLKNMQSIMGCYLKM